jgi:GNAT superfamily N-acetyltransferase
MSPHVEHLQSLQSLQSHLPTRGVVVSLLIIVAVFVVVMVVVLIRTHRYKYAFWKNKPVAWATLWPTAFGKITTHTVSQTETETETEKDDALPDGYTIVHIRRATDMVETDRRLKQIATLWNTAPAPHARTVDATDVLWTLRTPSTEAFLLYHNNATVVGTLVCSRQVLCTPVEDEQDVYHVRHLCIHPTHRNKRLAPGVMHYALQTARRRDQTEPVALFAVPWAPDRPTQNRLPFAEVSRTMRVHHRYNPTLLLDADTEVAHRIIRRVRDLPARAYETSDLRIGNTSTLEPNADSSDRAAYWKYCIAHPQHVVLSVGGTDWIHIEHVAASSSSSSSSITATPATPATVTFKGCSFDHSDMDKVVPHLFAYVKEACASETTTDVVVIIPQPLAATFDEHPYLKKEPQHTRWAFLDAHYVYMYNYKLNQMTVHLPCTLNTM